MTVMLQQECGFFSFKIVGQACDVSLMLVLGKSSYPVTDSDIYFVNDRSSEAVGIDHS